MTTKFLALVSVIGLAGICLVQGQSPTPGESPAASPSPAKHRAHKKADATNAASPAAEAASPSPTAKPTRKPKATPATSPAPAAAMTKATPAPGGGPGLVWVNTDTHVYHKEGSRFYGKTKAGKYVSEADARKEGNRPAARDY